MDNGKIQLHNVDFDDFIKAVDECKGDVYLETKDGDVLNLKSKLCHTALCAAGVTKSLFIAEPNKIWLAIPPALKCLRNRE